MVGFRLDEANERRLQRFADETRRSKSDIAREALIRLMDRHDLALRAEAARQSEMALARGWNAEDAFWESVAALDDFEAAPEPRADL
jgi:predicted transcriptional regulator